MNECRIARVSPNRSHKFRHRVGGAYRNRHSLFVEAEKSLETKKVMNLKEILVPMDFKGCALRALDKAIPLARQLEAKIILLYVVDIPNVLPMGTASDYQSHLEQLRSDAKNKFGGLIPRWARRDVVFETAVVEDILHETILDFRRKRNIEIIVPGKKRGKFWQIFRRHTAEWVQKQSPCLVQVVCEENALIENQISNPESSTI